MAQGAAAQYRLGSGFALPSRESLNRRDRGFDAITSDHPAPLLGSESPLAPGRGSTHAPEGKTGLSPARPAGRLVAPLVVINALVQRRAKSMALDLGVGGFEQALRNLISDESDLIGREPTRLPQSEHLGSVSGRPTVVRQPGRVRPSHRIAQGSRCHGDNGQRPG